MANAETEDWRRKYMDNLRSMEREERQYRDQQRILYKLVGRLCLTAQGQSTRLDQALSRLRDAVRREAAVGELEALGQEVTDGVLEKDHGTATLRQITVVGGDEAGPLPAASPAGKSVVDGENAAAERIRQLLLRLLAEVAQETRLVEAASVIQGELGTTPRPEALPEYVERVGGVLVERLHGLERMRQELELLLGQMLGQLESISRDVEGIQNDETRRSSSNQTLNLQVSGEIRALDESITTGSDISLIRRQLRQRLDAISSYMQEHREREEQLASQAQSRAEQMRGRMEELEGEARKLRSSLMDEKRLSLLDPLTQIGNRLAYEQRLADEMDRWAGGAQPLCMAVWDIDQFKAVNDRFGHRAGDRVITVVAKTLEKGIRSTDFIARYGGEEFVLLLPGTGLSDALALVERMREAVSKLGFHVRGAPVAITISCGITELKPGDSAEAAFERADKALYRAKESGRNRVVSV